MELTLVQLAGLFAVVVMHHLNGGVPERCCELSHFCTWCHNSLSCTQNNSHNTEYIFVTPLSRSKDTEYAWEDVKALFNGGSRKRTSTSSPTDPELSPLPSKITPPAAGMFSSVNETTPSYESLSKSLHSTTAGGSFTRHAIPTAAANYSLFSANLHSLFTSSPRCVSAVWALFRLFLLCRPINV